MVLHIFTWFYWGPKSVNSHHIPSIPCVAHAEPPMAGPGADFKVLRSTGNVPDSARSCWDLIWPEMCGFLGCSLLLIFHYFSIVFPLVKTQDIIFSSIYWTTELHISHMLQILRVFVPFPEWDLKVYTVDIGTRPSCDCAASQPVESTVVSCCLHGSGGTWGPDFLKGRGLCKLTAQSIFCLRFNKVMRLKWSWINHEESRHDHWSEFSCSNIIAVNSWCSCDLLRHGSCQPEGSNTFNKQRSQIAHPSNSCAELDVDFCCRSFSLSLRVESYRASVSPQNRWNRRRYRCTWIQTLWQYDALQQVAVVWHLFLHLTVLQRWSLEVRKHWIIYVSQPIPLQTGSHNSAWTAPSWL